MSNNSLASKLDLYQLVCIGFNLSHRIDNLSYLTPHVLQSSQGRVIQDLALQFREEFIRVFIGPKEGA